MQEKLQQYRERIDAMQLRERALLLCICLVGVFFLIDTFALQPTLRQQERQKEAIIDWELQLNVLSERSGLLSEQPAGELLELRHGLREQLADLEDRLRDQLGTLLKPAQAVEVLEQVLGQEQDLKLLELEAVSKPLTGLEFEGQAELTISDIGRYELRLELEGSYLGTLRYLRALEALPWKFFWESVDFEVIEYPLARVTLQIYTLGLLQG